jgi:uncharacterized Zn ribbon protein
MAKKTQFCYNCDTEYVVSCKGRSDFHYCPLCGEEISEEDEDLMDEEDND